MAPVVPGSSPETGAPAEMTRFKVGNRSGPGLGPVCEPAQQGRRAEQVRHAEIVDRLEDLRRIDPRRSRRVHVGHDRRHPQRRGEQGEERERAEIDLAGLDRVERAKRFDLCLEDRVRVDGPLGRAGAAAGEEDRRRCRRREQRDRRSWVESLVRETRAPRRRTSSSVVTPVPEAAALPPGATMIVWRTVSRPQPRSRRAQSALGMPMKTSGAASRQHWPRFAQADPGVDQHRHDARLEQGENQREEVEAGPDHHHGPRAAGDSHAP